MKILRIIARLNVGGPARHVTLLNAGLDARGHETVLVHGSLAPGEASLEELARRAGIRLVHVADLGRRVTPGSDLRAFRALQQIIRAERPDVVHTHTAKAGTLGRLAAFAYNATRRRSSGALVVHTFHGHVLEGYFSPAVNRAVRLVERSLAHTTDVVVTISPRQRADIVDRFRIASAAQTAVVPLGLDLDALLGMDAGAPDLRSAIGASAGDVIVGYAGRMVPVKDLDTLLRAFAAALARVPAMRLVLAGDGPQRARVQAMAGDLGIGPRTHFIGWTDDLTAFHATADIFALSSINEGTPVAAIEAMAAARPVAATAVGGVPDVVESGTHGILVPARATREFADALVCLATDAPLRYAMGRAGRARARDRYSHVRLVDDIEQLYTDALAARRDR